MKPILLLSVTMIALLGWQPANASAAYKPIPNHLYVKAMKKKAPAKRTRARLAWSICRVWGKRRCRGALNVAWCEGGLRTWARNGQYRGTFQMGSRERMRYGHGRSIWIQAKSALKYWRVSRWSPWECKPYRR